ncbi:MAG: hypothetical protein ACLSWI_00640 [Candidatus Gastranaerophilaceae bacterium]
MKNDLNNILYRLNKLRSKQETLYDAFKYCSEESKNLYHLEFLFDEIMNDTKSVTNDLDLIIIDDYFDR